MRVVPFLIILMWAGLLWSRALLSMSMIAFFIFTIFFSGKDGWALIMRSTWLKLMILLFLVPLVTIFWSADTDQWVRSVQVKLPLLLMPLAVPMFRAMDKKSRNLMLLVFCGSILLSSLYSYWNYFSTPGIHELYLKAKVLPVAMSNDHVRYGWYLAIGYAWLLYTLLKGEVPEKMRIAAWCMLGYLGVFIHVLAAKTGLIGFYTATGVAIFTMVPRRFRIASVIIMVAIPLIGWFLLPSFQNRLKFVLWDFQNYSKGSYVEGLSDGPRILSYQAGANIIKEHPVAGVGSGDVLVETWKWYDINAPFLKDYERLLPSNEVMIYACAGGLISGLVCLAALLIPFFLPLRNNMLWLSFHLVCFAGFMYEIGLEVQHGVFLYSFFSCWFYSMLSPSAPSGTT